uniref:Uncharacterized protein n=1 Tax=Candidatus Kentrum sp. TC TaxID=2126339 RepID=A0A450Z3B2_9GAMM|nr:MAG: hypothetical protein BECKTC1821E_GA0114239_11093 [Candidatus Kentron sp. TC]
MANPEENISLFRRRIGIAFLDREEYRGLGYWHTGRHLEFQSSAWRKKAMGAPYGRRSGIFFNFAL